MPVSLKLSPKKLSVRPSSTPYYPILRKGPWCWEYQPWCPLAVFKSHSLKPNKQGTVRLLLVFVGNGRHFPLLAGRQGEVAEMFGLFFNTGGDAIAHHTTELKNQIIGHAIKRRGPFSTTR